MTYDALCRWPGVELICNDAFEATLEFLIQLSEPKGAVLGTKSCRILIADDDSFPTNKNHDKLVQGRIEDISGEALMSPGNFEKMTDSKVKGKSLQVISCHYLPPKNLKTLTGGILYYTMLYDVTSCHFQSLTSKASSSQASILIRCPSKVGILSNGLQ